MDINSWKDQVPIFSNFSIHLFCAPTSARLLCFTRSQQNVDVHDVFSVNAQAKLALNVSHDNVSVDYWYVCWHVCWHVCGSSRVAALKNERTAGEKRCYGMHLL